MMTDLAETLNQGDLVVDEVETAEILEGLDTGDRRQSIVGQVETAQVDQLAQIGHLRDLSSCLL
jgi:hypothetical protein